MVPLIPPRARSPDRKETSLIALDDCHAPGQLTDEVGHGRGLMPGGDARDWPR
jgi:hypothetical protein